jgi:hypothetical protein
VVVRNEYDAALFVASTSAKSKTPCCFWQDCGFPRSAAVLLVPKPSVGEALTALTAGCGGGLSVGSIFNKRPVDVGCHAMAGSMLYWTSPSGARFFEVDPGL